MVRFTPSLGAASLIVVLRSFNLPRQRHRLGLLRRHGRRLGLVEGYWSAFRLRPRHPGRGADGLARPIHDAGGGGGPISL
jgi:hypothetical protein